MQFKARLEEGLRKEHTQVRVMEMEMDLVTNLKARSKSLGWEAMALEAEMVMTAMTAMTAMVELMMEVKRVRKPPKTSVGGKWEVHRCGVGVLDPCAYTVQLVAGYGQVRGP